MTYTMRITMIAAAVAAAGLGGCGGDQAAPPSAVRPADPAPAMTTKADPKPPAQVQASAANPAAVAKATPVAAANIPADARFTILCREYTGPTHVQQAMLAKSELIRLSGKGDWHIITNDEQGSQLFFGYYRVRDGQADAVEGKRITGDLEWLKSLKNETGGRAFPTVVVIALPVADPEAPPEFDITKLDADKPIDDPNRAYWTIAIAAYTADARGEGADAGKSRKQFAVEAVMEARQRFGVPAYYHHGESVSTVCIGAWPRSAIKEQEANRAKSRGDTGEELVVAAAPLGDELTRKLEGSGRDIKVVQPKIEILDPVMLETWKQFPEYAVDGRVQVRNIPDPRTHQTTQRRQSSFLVEIPRAQGTLLRGNAPEAAPPPSLLAPTLGTPTNNGGRLRSVDR